MAPRGLLVGLESYNSSAIYALWHYIQIQPDNTVPSKSGPPYLLYQALFDYGLHNTYYMQNYRYQNLLYLVFDTSEMDTIIPYWNVNVKELLHKIGAVLSFGFENVEVYYIHLTKEYDLLFHNNFDALPAEFVEQMHLPYMRIDSETAKNTVIDEMIRVQYPYFTLVKEKRYRLAELINEDMGTTITAKDIHPKRVNYDAENLGLDILAAIPILKQDPIIP